MLYSSYSHHLPRLLIIARPDTNAGALMLLFLTGKRHGVPFDGDDTPADPEDGRTADDERTGCDAHRDDGDTTKRRRRGKTRESCLGEGHAELVSEARWSALAGPPKSILLQYKEKRNRILGIESVITTTFTHINRLTINRTQLPLLLLLPRPTTLAGSRRSRGPVSFGDRGRSVRAARRYFALPIRVDGCYKPSRAKGQASWTPP
ncbi:hypothetical protein FOCC_FOCC004594 [Frankliniella occidentalis]|nr:hypothetical protein FOCC_FOCC004594 [Frankliniella occidentalis]